MFIRRKEWENKCDENRKLITNKVEKDLLIENLKEELRNAEKHNMLLQEELTHKDQTLEFQKNRISELGRDNDILMTANQKLTDWVNKIINEVGIYEVEDKKTVVIPIHKNSRRVAAFSSIDEAKEHMKEFLEQEEIIIPEIRFVRMK